MNAIDIGSQRFTKIYVNDEAGAGGAFHEYSISEVGADPEMAYGNFGTVNFQNGPVGENGVNGCHQEDLLAIVMHRLLCFQGGDFACRENEMALEKIEEAMHWLNSRTTSRQKQGVEGTSKHREAK